MRIVVNHLTRMERGYVCVAGIDMETGAHVRPVVDHRMRETLLRRHGGPFDLGGLVDLGAARRIGVAPALEDHSFRPREARWVQDVSPTYFWRLLERVAQPRLTAIFGEQIVRHHRTYALPAGTGTATLGCLRPMSISIDRAPYGKVRVCIADAAHAEPVSLSLTDLRFYEDDHETPRWELVDVVAARIAAGVPVIASVGLGRAYRALGDDRFWHWLQVNNLHLRDDPLWQDRSRG